MHRWDIINHIIEKNDTIMVIGDKEKLDKLKEISTSKEIPAGAIPKDIAEKIEELPVSSLLSKPEEEDKPTDSLLGRE